jgi:hypothetical protein
MLRTTSTRLLVFAFCLVLTGSAKGVELINNGSFETDDFTGWTVEGMPGTLFEVTDFWGHAGTHSVVFAGLESHNDRISQIAPTASGKQYVLDFWVNNGSDGNLGVGEDGLAVFWEGAAAFNISPLPAQLNTWLNYTLNVTATSNGSELKFHGFDAPFAIYLDDISLTAVPEPNALLLLAVGITGVAMRARRRR